MKDKEKKYGYIPEKVDKGYQPTEFLPSPPLKDDSMPDGGYVPSSTGEPPSSPPGDE